MTVDKNHPGFAMNEAPAYIEQLEQRLRKAERVIEACHRVMFWGQLGVKAIDAHGELFDDAKAKIAAWREADDE